MAGGQLAASDGDVDEILQVAAGLEGVKEVEITPLDARGQAKVYFGALISVGLNMYFW